MDNSIIVLFITWDNVRDSESSMMSTNRRSTVTGQWDDWFGPNKFSWFEYCSYFWCVSVAPHLNKWNICTFMARRSKNNATDVWQLSPCHHRIETKPPKLVTSAGSSSDKEIRNLHSDCWLLLSLYPRRATAGANVTSELQSNNFSDEWINSFQRLRCAKHLKLKLKIPRLLVWHCDPFGIPNVYVNFSKNSVFHFHKIVA